MPEFVLTGQMNVIPPDMRSVKKQMQKDINGISVLPLNQVPVVSSQIKKLNTELSKTLTISKNVEDSFFSAGDNLGKTVRRFGAFTVATTALFGVIRSFQANIKEAILFEKELVKISQVTGTSIKGLSDLKDEITSLSTGLGVSSTKLLSVSRVLAQAGLAADDVKTSLAAIAKSDLAPTFDNVEQTTEGVIALMRQFKKEAKDVEGVLGSINAVAGKFAVESADLIQFIRGAGGTFEAAGGTIEELFGLGTSIRATTRESAASIATGLRTIFARLQRSRTQSFLEDFNIQLKLSAEEAKKFGRTEGEFVGPFEAIKRLSLALKQIPSTDPRFAQIIEELGGFRQINKVIPLIKQNALAQQSYNVALQGTNSLNKDAEKALTSLSNKLDRLGEKFIEISRILLDNQGVKETIDQILTLSNVVLDAVKSVSSLASLITLLPLGSLLVAKPFIQGFQGIARNKGGSVPGVGNTDTVPAMLTPGEFVLRKSAVSSIGLAKLTAMNATGKVQGFNAGGLVGDTVRQIQGAGVVYTLSSILSVLIPDFKKFNDSIVLAAGSFSLLSLGTSMFKKDYTKGNKEIEETIEKLKESMEEMVASLGSHKKGLEAKKVAEEKVIAKEAAKMQKAAAKTKKPENVEEVVEESVATIPLSPKERIAQAESVVKKTAVFRNQETGQILDAQKVNNLRTRIEEELSKSFYGIDVKGIVQNPGMSSSLTDLLKSGIDFDEITKGYQRTPTGDVLAQFLSGETAPKLFKQEEKGKKSKQEWVDFGDDSYGLKFNQPGVGQAEATLRYKDDKSSVYLDMFGKSSDAPAGSGKKIIKEIIEATKSYNPEFFEGHFTNKAALGAFGSAFGRKNVSFFKRSDGTKEDIDFDKAMENPDRYIARANTGLAFQETPKYLDIQDRKVKDGGFPDNFYAATGYKGAVSQDVSVKDVLSKFSSGELTRRQVESTFKGTDFAGVFRSFIRENKTDKARVLIGRSLKAENNVSTEDFISSMAGGTIAENLSSDPNYQEIADLFRNIALYGREEQERLVQLLMKMQELENLQLGSVLTDEMGNILSKEAALKTGKGFEMYDSPIGPNLPVFGPELPPTSLPYGITADPFVGPPLPPPKTGPIDQIESQIQKQIKDQENLIRSEEQKIKANNKIQKRLDTLSLAINIASSAFLALGNFLDKDVKSRMQSFQKGLGSSENIARDAGLASAATGFGVGASAGSLAGGQIGAMFGPIGALIGTGAGGLVGGIGNALYNFTNAYSEAERQIQSIIRNRTIDKFESALLKVASGDIGVLAGSRSINSGASTALNDVLTLQGSADREDLFGRLESMRNPLQEFINNVSSSVSSLKEFKGIVGEDTIRLFLTLNSIPIDQFNDEVEKSIKLSSRSRSIDTNSLKAAQDLLIRMMMQRNLVSSVNDSILSLDKNLHSLDSTVSAIDGSFKTNLNLTGIDRLSKIGNIVKFDEFESDVQKLGNIFGNSGRIVSENSLKVAKALQVLPNILLDVNSKSSLEGTGEFTTKVEDELASAGIGKDLASIITSQIDAIIGPENKDQNIISKLRSDFDGTVSQITKGLSGLSDPLKEAASMFQSKFNQLGDLLDQRANIENKVEASFVKMLDVFDQSERITAGIEGRNIDFNKLLGLEDKIQFGITNVPNLVNNPQGTFDRLLSAEENLRKSQEKLQNSTNLTGEEMLSLRNGISLQKAEVMSLTSNLEFMSDVSKRTALAQEAINREQKDRQTKFGFAETLTFGSEQEIRQLASSIQLTNRAIQEGSLDNFSADQKKEVQNLLNKVGDTALFQGGLTGEKVKQILVGNNIKRLGGDARGVALPGDNEKRLQERVLEAVARAEQSQALLYEFMVLQDNDFNTKLNDTLQKFITDLSSTLKESTVNQIEGDIKRKTEEKNRTAETVNRIKGWEQASNTDFNTLLSLSQGFAEFEKLKKSTENLENRKMFSGKDGLGIGALKGITTEKVVIGTASAGYGPGTTITEDRVPVKQSKLIIDSLEQQLLSQIDDKQAVANIMADVAKNVLPASIEKRGSGQFINQGKFLEGVDKLIEGVLETKRQDLELEKAKREELLGFTGSDEDKKKAEGIAKVMAEFSVDIQQAAKDLGENFNMKETENRLATLTEEIRLLNDSLSKTRGEKPFSAGGLVGGQGNRDSISARLTPGEFVLNRKTVERIGISNLNRLNKSNSRAPVSSSTTSSSTTSTSMQIAQESLSQLNRAMQTFAFNVERLEKAFSSFPTEITITGRHFVEVVINGAQVLQNIKPEVAGLIESEVKKSINKMLKDKFPDKGQVI